MRTTLTAFTIALLLSPAVAAARPPSTPPADLPAWEQLDAEQRELLLAPVRDRWNGSDAAGRRHMLERARGWKDMPPDKRRHALHGMQRWTDMPPDKRREARALYEKMKTLPESERDALRARWKAMTPEQRRAWVEANPAREEAPPGR